MNKFAFVLFVFLATGCSSIFPQKMNLATQPIEVSSDKLNQYWEMKYESFSFSSGGKPQNRPKGYVKIRYLIDSNGDVFNPEVVESQPTGVWDEKGLRAIKELEYSPSQNNVSKVPVYVTTKFQFEEKVLQAI